MLNYGSFCVSAALRGLAVSRPDVVIATSPQLLVGLSGWWIARWAHARFVFEVRDLWPESLDAVGIGSERSLLHRILSGVAGFLYENANHVVVVTTAFKDHLVRHWRVPPSKVSVVENGVETDLFSPGAVDMGLKKQFGLEEKFVVGYVGTMGLAHSLDTLVDAASTLQSSRPEIVLLLVGEGADKERIKGLAASRGLRNLCFVDQQPRERIPAFICASDVCLVLLKKTELFKTVIPTKMLEFMSCARPVVLGVDGQARQILEEAQAGIFVEPEDRDALLQAIVRLAGEDSARRDLGHNGRQYVLKRCSREMTARRYITVLQELLRAEDREAAGTPR